MPRYDPNANAYDEDNMRDLRVKIGVLHSGNKYNILSFQFRLDDREHNPYFLQAQSNTRSMVFLQQAKTELEAQVDTL